MIDYRFYDTCSLLLMGEELFEDRFGISSITLEELEHIKVSAHKDPEIKYAARRLLRMLDEHLDDFDVVIWKEEYGAPILERGMELTNDMKVLASALAYDRDYHPDETIFITNDLALKVIAHTFFGEDCIASVDTRSDDYCGYKEITLSEDEISAFYSRLEENWFDLLVNEYLVLKNQDGEVIDLRCWDGSTHRYLNSKPVSSKEFGTIGAYQSDLYQKMALDSLKNNQLTVLRGPAGSGKSLLGLGYLFWMLEQHKIEQIYIFCNPVATKDSAKLGFYPGSKDEKIIDGQIGHFLASKFGDPIEVEKLVADGKLVLIPASDCRGIDVPTSAGVYITEAQNTTISIMKLLIQRANEVPKFIIEGDDLAQVDLNTYEGKNNGLARVSEVFRGHNLYGEVTLQNIHRSELARIAQEM